jgi:hypothetical protein
MQAVGARAVAEQLLLVLGAQHATGSGLASYSQEQASVGLLPVDRSDCTLEESLPGSKRWLRCREYWVGEHQYDGLSAAGLAQRWPGSDCELGAGRPP